MLRILLFVLSLIVSSVCFSATLDAVAAYALLQANPQAVLIDVRDPIEVKFTGFATPTKVHVPFKFVDVSQWDSESMSYAMVANPDFDKQVTQRLSQLDVKQDAPILMMCRSGQRAAKAAERLSALGYTQVIAISDGFEGAAEKSGEFVGQRRTSGWRNRQLPWSDKLPEGIVWRP